MKKSLVTSLCFPFLFQYAAAAAKGTSLYDCVSSAFAASKFDISSNNITSRIVVPSDSYYEDVRVGPIIREEYPAMVGYVVNVKEVQALVKCAAKTGVQAVPRTGGHHFESWSALNNSLVIDISHLDGVAVSGDKKSAVIGAGLRLGSLYSALSQYGVTFAGGICPTVGIGGYVSVGGYNMQMRALGMAVDHITQAKLVLADGTLVTASATHYPDLFWGIRGGGTYGIIVELTVDLVVLPRSAMISVTFNDTSTLYEVARKYLDWAPRQVPEFNSQVNIYNDRIQLVGWYLGGTVDQLNAIVKTSGLLTIPSEGFSISGNCSTANSRLFWLYSVDTCIDDAEAETLFSEFYNTVPQGLVPIQPSFAFNEQVKNTAQPRATPWSRLNIINKTYMIKKDNILSNETLKGIMERIQSTTTSQGFWAELTSFNSSVIGNGNNSAYPYEKDGYALLRAELDYGTTDEEYATNQAWMDDFNAFVIPRNGEATYTGYIDANLTTNIYTSYYGNNVCPLVKVKKAYDPSNFFRNPFSIPPYVPRGITC